MAIINDLSARYANDGAADAAFVAAGWAKSEGVMYYDTTLNQFKRWDAVLSAWVFDAGTISGGDAFPGIETMQALFVDQGTNVAEDGSATSPFHSVASAYAAAKLLVPTEADQIAIIIMGGTYVETLTMDTAYIHLVGQGIAATKILNTATAAPTVYINDIVNGYARIEDLTIENTQYTQHAFHLNNSNAFLRSVRMVGYNYTTAHALNISGATVKASFDLCSFEGNQNNYHDVATINYTSGAVHFISCTLGNQGNGYWHITRAPLLRFIGCVTRIPTYDRGIVFIISTTAGSVVEFVGCRLYAANYELIRIQIGCTVIVTGCHLSGSDYCITASNAGAVIIAAGNTFQATSYDIYSSVALTTPAQLSGNRMSVGMHGNVRTACPIKDVGGTAEKYANIEQALASVYADDSIVRLNEDVTVTAALAPPSYRTIIDGQGTFKITRGKGLPFVAVDDEDDITFRGCSLVGSADFAVAADAAKLTLDDCYMVGMIDIQAGVAGDLIQVIHCDIIGDDTDKVAMRIDDADPTIRVYDSYLRGYEAQIDNFAVYFNKDNNTFMAVQSDFLGWHDVEVPERWPFGAAGGLTPNITLYHDGLNAALAVAFTNLIATPYNVIDQYVGCLRHIPW